MHIHHVLKKKKKKKRGWGGGGGGGAIDADGTRPNSAVSHRNHARTSCGRRCDPYH